MVYAKGFPVKRNDDARGARLCYAKRVAGKGCIGCCGHVTILVRSLLLFRYCGSRREVDCKQRI